MTERCRVSEEELHYDNEQMRLSELYEEHIRAAEYIIESLEDLKSVLDGIEHAENIEQIALLKAIRSHNTQKLGEIVLQILKAELIATMRD